MLDDIKNKIQDKVRGYKDRMLDRAEKRSEERLANYIARIVSETTIFNPLDRKAIKKAREENKEIIDNYIRIVKGID